MSRPVKYVFSCLRGVPDDDLNVVNNYAVVHMKASSFGRPSAYHRELKVPHIYGFD